MIKTITVSKTSIKYALTKFHILDLALKGAKNPLGEFERVFKRRSYFKSVINEIQKVKKKLKKFSIQKLLKNWEWPVAIQELLPAQFTQY